MESLTVIVLRGAEDLLVMLQVELSVVREIIEWVWFQKRGRGTFFSSRMTVSWTPLGLKQWVGSG